jgi:hypothetical protein
VFTVDASQEGDHRATALMMIDRPNYSIRELVDLMARTKRMSPEQQKAEVAKFSASHEPPRHRLFMGRGDDKSVALKLMDANGKDRIVIQVTPDGTPVLRFLDAEGKVISQLPQKP